MPLTAEQLQHHPIDPEIREQIQSRLSAIESTHQVRVVYACESGSRAWGFASPDSDYDVRFLYVHALPWYLRVSQPRDVIELPISKVLDINGWELRKALGLLKKGNATLIEWLDSPVVYQADARFVEEMGYAIEHVHRCDSSFHHYLSMARGNYQDHLGGETVRLKKYLYVLRPLLAAMWVERYHTPAPMRFAALVDGLITDPTLRDAIEQLLTIKRAATEAQTAQPIPIIHALIERELARLETPPQFQINRTGDVALDRLLYDTVMGRKK